MQRNAHVNAILRLGAYVSSSDRLFPVAFVASWSCHSLMQRNARVNTILRLGAYVPSSHRLLFVAFVVLSLTVRE